MNEIKDRLIEKIKSGDIQMVPRWQIILKASLWVAGAFLVAVITIYLFSFIVFALHKSGVLFAPLYGWSGFMMFIVSSPWILILILGVFLFLLYILVSHFSLSYKKPLVYTIVGVVLFVIGVSSLLQQVSIHERMHPFIERHNVPGLAPMYRQALDRKPDGVVSGSLEGFGEGFVTIETSEGEIVRISTTTRTKIPRRGLLLGEEVVVLGEITDNGLEAFGIRPFEKRFFRNGLKQAPRDLNY